MHLTQSTAYALRKNNTAQLSLRAAKSSNFGGKQPWKEGGMCIQISLFCYFLYTSVIVSVFQNCTSLASSQSSACAGWWPAAVCESRPSQGQTEPLCYPLLPCVPPGFFPPFSSFSFFFFFFLNTAQTLSLCSSAWFVLFFVFLLLSSALRKQKTGWKTATTCCSQSYLQCRSPL